MVSYIYGRDIIYIIDTVRDIIYVIVESSIPNGIATVISWTAVLILVSVFNTVFIRCW